MARHSFYLQNIKISFEQFDFYSKISLIKDAGIKNSTTQLTILNKGQIIISWKQEKQVLCLGTDVHIMLL